VVLLAEAQLAGTSLDRLLQRVLSVVVVVRVQVVAMAAQPAKQRT